VQPSLAGPIIPVSVNPDGSGRGLNFFLENHDNDIRKWVERRLAKRPSQYRRPDAGTAYGNPPYTTTFTVTTGGPILFGVSVFCGFGNYTGCLVSGHITVEALS